MPNTEYSRAGFHRVIGLMSGTSLDGIDTACVEIRDDGETFAARLEAFLTVPFADETRDGLRRLCENATAPEIAVWNFQLSELFGEAALQLL